MIGLRAASTVALLLTALSTGCNTAPSAGATGTGGTAGSSAGGDAAGGRLSSGGSSGSGGNLGGAGSPGGGGSSVGGSESSGGSSATGGSQGSGGSPGSGGNSGKPDAGTTDSGRPDTSQGGSMSTGGSGGGGVSTGGSAGGGGATGVGGATSSTFWPNTYKATTGASGMNTGQDCMSSCHGHGFAFGGTVYDSSGKPKSQVEIGIKPTSGSFVSVFSGGDGNFHYSGSGLNLAGADIRVRDSNGESQMPVNAASAGGCNSCHTGGTGTARISAP